MYANRTKIKLALTECERLIKKNGVIKPSNLIEVTKRYFIGTDALV